MEHERILLALEGDTLRSSLKRLLQIEGHEVVAAIDTLTDVQKIANNPDVQFRVAIVSAFLPDEGMGQLAADYIKDCRPDVLVISHSAGHQTFGDYHVRLGDNPNLLLEAISKA